MIKSSKLSIPDSRMLALLDWSLANKLVSTEKEYFEKIKFARTNISNIRRGHQSFTRDHILEACKFTGANANWILGLETNMMRKESKKPLDQIKQAIVALESELKTR